MNYALNSPFKDLLPPISDLWSHPLHFLSAWKNVVVMHEKDKATKAREHRLAHQDDVAKRRYFMKMHGIETKDPITIMFGKDEDDGPSAAELEAQVLGTEPPKKEEPAEPKRKKMFGVF